MNIGIVTLPLIDNYGCVLQNYAMQQVLKKLGHCPITLDIRGRKLNRRLLSLIKQIVHKPFDKTSYIIPNKKYSRSEGFQSFIDKYINHTPPIYRYSKSVCKKYQLRAVLTGSDQVWRYGYSLFPKDMFLKFVPDEIIKFSYAASFGTDRPSFPTRKYNEYTYLLKRFNGVSVREESGVNICQEYFNHGSKHVLDPTLLLAPEDYLSLCSDKECGTSLYLGVYFLDKTEDKLNIAIKISEQKGIPLKIFETKSGASPIEWLHFYRNASFIVTDSFHGAVFSIIFNIQFLVIDNPNRGSSRFDSLLSTFNLKKSIISSIQTDNFAIPPMIDYNHVNNILAKHKAISIKFLSDMLSE